MEKNPGNLIAEYGLILALVVLVSVGALGYLGGVLSQSYTTNGDLSQADQLFGLLGGSSGSSGGGDTIAAGTPSTAPTSSGLSAEVLQAYINAGIPDGGFEVPIGSANLASSAEGSEKVSETLNIIASTGFLPDGTNLEQAFGPKWTDVKGFLEQMAHYGGVISDEEFNTLGTIDNPVDAYVNMHDVQNNMAIYSDIHGQLEGYVNSMFPEDSSEANSLKNFINTASGVITYGAKEFLVKADTDYGLGFEDSTHNAPSLMKLSGYSVMQGDIVTIPVNTQQEADNLEQAASTASAVEAAGVMGE